MNLKKAATTAAIAFGTMWALEMLAVNNVFNWRSLVKDLRSMGGSPPASEG